MLRGERVPGWRRARAGRILRRVWRTVVASVLVVACAGTHSSGAGIEQERAVEVAREAAVRSGYDLQVYEATSVERVARGAHAGRYRVSFVHRPPAPPGGHFGVYVDPATWDAELVPGR